MKVAVLKVAFIVAVAAADIPSAAAEPPSAPPKAGAVRSHTADDFRAFFQRSGKISAQEVRARFGVPVRYAPLMIGEAEKDATPEHSWWHYVLSDKREVNVAVDRSQVGAVIIVYPERPEGQQAEVIRR